MLAENAGGSRIGGWKAVMPTYSVTLEINRTLDFGGVVNVTAILGKPMPRITPPRRTGKTFGGYWSGAGGTGTQYYDANGRSVRDWDIEEDRMLYAKWD